MESVQASERLVAVTGKAEAVDLQVQAWMQEHGSAVLRLAYAYLLRSDQAEDIFQEVFVKAYRHVDRLQEPAKVRPWLLQVTANQCRDLLRSAWWRRVLPLGQGRGEPGEQLYGVDVAGYQQRAGSESDPAMAVLGADLKDSVLRAIGALPTGYRETVVLHYLEGLSTAEVARITGVRDGTVHSRLSRARRLLREQLEGWGVEP